MGGRVAAARCEPRAVGASAVTTTIVAATYNIHRCIGTDGRYSPARIADVIGELDADVVGLQEVDQRLNGGGGLDQLSFIAQRLGFDSAVGTSATSSATSEGRSGNARCGRCQNAVLSRWPIGSCRLVDLTVSGREPRSAIDARLVLTETGLPDAPVLRTVVTHFGLRPGERRQQLETLLGRLDEAGEPDMPMLLLGDLNEWRRKGPVSRGLGAMLMCGRSVGSFPARYPLLPLDRICGRSLIMASGPHRHVSATARVASDHLPVCATFDLGSLMADASQAP